MKAEPVAYLLFGSYACPSCARRAVGSPSNPVYAADLPSGVWCRGCEDPIVKPASQCPFCEIAEGVRQPPKWVVEREHWPETMAFTPIGPVTEGHTLVVPKVHVADFSSVPEITAMTVRRAAELVHWSDRPMNLITSRGREATQSVFHLHLHLVPREHNDGLALPWYSGKSRRIKNPGGET